MKSYRVAAIWACAAAAALVSGVAQAQSPSDTWYDLGDNPAQMKLLGLDTIAGSGAVRTVLEVDLLQRSPQPLGVVNTWQVDCEHSRMRVIKAMLIEPGHSHGDQDVLGDYVSVNHDPQGHKLSALVCTGAGNLLRNHTYRGDITKIISKYWGP